VQSASNSTNVERAAAAAADQIFHNDDVEVTHRREARWKGHQNLRPELP